MELYLRCQWGQKRKHGKIVRSGNCFNRASGIYRVYPMRGQYKAYAICATCALTVVPNHRVCIMPGKDAPADAKPMYVKAVSHVELIASLNTDFDQGKTIHKVGSKHWVEPTTEPKPEMEGGAYTIKRHKPHGEKMDMAAYLNSLRKHDDGK